MTASNPGCPAATHQTKALAKGGSPVTTCMGPYLPLPMEDVLRESGVDEAVHFCQLCDVPQGHRRILRERGHEGLELM